jgi:hypothetical protein
MRFVLALALVAGCSKTRIKECDDFVRTAEAIARCETLPQSTRESMKRPLAMIKSSLQGIDDLGDQVTKAQLEALGRTCQRQHDTIRELYGKSAPECLR